MNSNIEILGKPLVCLDLVELREAETKIVETIVTDNDKLLLEQKAVASKEIPLSVYLVTRDAIEKRTDCNVKILKVVRERIDTLLEAITV